MGFINQKLTHIIIENLLKELEALGNQNKLITKVNKKSKKIITNLQQNLENSYDKKQAA